MGGFSIDYSPLRFKQLCSSSTPLVPTFHGAEGEGGGGHHVAAGLHLVELGHEGGQLVGGQVLLPLQVHADFLPNMSAKLEI